MTRQPYSRRDWTVYLEPDSCGLLHVFPNDDLRDHVTDGAGCWCKPGTDGDAGHILVHNSMDRRESGRLQ